MCDFIIFLLTAIVDAIVSWLVARWLDDHFGK